MQNPWEDMLLSVQNVTAKELKAVVKELRNEMERIRVKNRARLRILTHIVGDIPGNNVTEKQKKMWALLKEELK